MKTSEILSAVANHNNHSCHYFTSTHEESCLPKDGDILTIEAIKVRTIAIPTLESSVTVADIYFKDSTAYMCFGTLGFWSFKGSIKYGNIMESLKNLSWDEAGPVFDTFIGKQIKVSALLTNQQSNFRVDFI